MKNELIFYSLDHINQRIEVQLSEDSVWLNRTQLALLFGRDIKTIGKHLNNALKEELFGLPVVAKFATTGSDGKIYQVEHVNLDMIISIGYRVKSRQGVHFRIWANQVLKDYLLKGYAVQHRVDNMEHQIIQIKEQIKTIDLQIKSQLPSTQGIFFEGEVFDAYILVAKIIRQARKNILLIDNYIDETTFTLLSKKKQDVIAHILTKNTSKQVLLDLKKANEQYGGFSIEAFNLSHDRFLILDNEDVYHLGASLKDLGKRWFAFTKMNLSNIEELLGRIKKH
mgnify:FL=1|jgi:hypothetical protein